MAFKSAISIMKHDHNLKAFVTFRVAGRKPSTKEIIQTLKIYPTQKGEIYSTERSTVTPTSGIWLFSTERILLSANLTEHLCLFFGFLSCWTLSYCTTTKMQTPAATEPKISGRFLELSKTSR